MKNMTVKDKILIADDDQLNIDILEIMLQGDYTILKANDGEEAYEIIKAEKDSLAVVLLDVIMPKMSGLDVMKAMSRKRDLKAIPVLVISADSDISVERASLKCGATDFLRKPFDPVIVLHRINNVVELYLYKNTLEHQVERQISSLKAQSEELHRSKLKVIDVLGTVVESRNLESGEHIRRVKTYTEILANKMKELYPQYGLTKDRIKVIVNASSLHDVGKICISDAILLKPGRLTPDEFEIMKSHTLKGCEVLSNIKDAWNEEYGQVSYEICRHHHERYDGRGYPDGLKGDEISIEAQLVSLADVYDALIHVRCYKTAFSKEQAYGMIVNGECGVFSPKLLECFEACREVLESVE